MHKWEMLWLVSLLTLGLSVHAASIVGSKHDLSTANTPEPCVFCHTPHGASDSITPLWNRKFTDTSLFQPYTSPTMGVTPASTPNALSLACLSCHDDGLIGGGSSQGAVYNGDQHAVINPPNRSTPFNPNCDGCHHMVWMNPPGVFVVVLDQGWQVGPDLRNDHPVSIDYASAQALDSELKVAPFGTEGWSDLKLYDGKVECPTCHNPHDSTYVPFLRKSNNQSQLCYTCHEK